MVKKIAFLVYPSWRPTRKKNKYFDAQINVGLIHWALFFVQK
jgi:hypothetical protein